MNDKNSKDGITVGRQGIAGTPETSEHWKQRVESKTASNTTGTSWTATSAGTTAEVPLPYNKLL